MLVITFRENGLALGYTMYAMTCLVLVSDFVGCNIDDNVLENILFVCIS